MSDRINKLDSIAIHEASLLNLLAYHDHFLSANIDAELKEFTSYTTFHSGIKDPIFNGSIMRESELNVLEKSLDDIASYFKKLGSPYQILIHPESDKEGAKQLMKATGFRFMGEQHSMGIALNDLNMRISYPKSLFIEKINSRERFDKWTDLSSIKLKLRNENRDLYIKAFENVDFQSGQYFWKKYIGWLNGEAVVTCTLILAGGLAGIYDVSLLPKIRPGLGIEDIIILKPLHDALKQGYNIGIALSNVGEIRKYRKLGFEEINRIPRYIKMRK